MASSRKAYVKSCARTKSGRIGHADSYYVCGSGDQQGGVETRTTEAGSGAT